jgi:hypothetical protein
VTVLSGLVRWWDRLGWQVSAALALTMLSLFALTEVPLLAWLEWFGTVGGLVTTLLMFQFGERTGLLVPVITGFAANVLFWTFVFLGAGRLVGVFRRRSAVGRQPDVLAPPRSNDRQNVKRAVVVVVWVLILGAAVFGLARAMPFVRGAIDMERHVRQAAPREPTAEQEWRKEFGDPERTLAAFPKVEDNETAGRLVELAHFVEIDMARPKAGQQPLRESNTEKAFRQAVGDYEIAELQRPDGNVGPPPETVRIFLEAHVHDFDAIVALLLAGAPAWKSDLSLGPEAPIPNLLGQIRLQRLLVARALSQAHLDEEAQAERTLCASWTLNESLRDRPDVISQLIAVAVTRLEVGLLRKIPANPTEWRARLVEHDYRVSMLKAMEVESVSRFSSLPFGSSTWDRASRADFLDLNRSLLVALRDSRVSDSPIGPNQLMVEAEKRPLSGGQVLATIAFPNLGNAIRRVDHLILDTELTDRVLEARLLKARLGHWPEDIPGVEASRMTGAHWTYAVSANARMTLSFSREPHWEDPKGLTLPLRFESN